MRERYISRGEAIAARLIGNEMMIMSATDSTFFTLDEVATVIWRAADGQTPLSQIALKICEQFDVDQQQAETDAGQFVDELAHHGILLVSDVPASGSGPRQEA
jgi:hypothetical protein